MFVRYNTIDEDIRPAIRSIHEKAHVHYIRFLMLRRTPVEEIEKDLLRLGLMTSPLEHYKLYFREVVYKSIVKRGLRLHYRNYLRGSENKLLTLETFGTNEDERIAFLKLTAECGVDYFFTDEAKSFYGFSQIPKDGHGQSIIHTDTIPDWESILTHPKRFLIEDMLLDGKSPAMISDYLEETTSYEIPAENISFFAKSFFNVKRRDLEITIEQLDDEYQQIQHSISLLREGGTTMLLGERNNAMGELRRRAETIKHQIRRLSGHHSRNAYVQGVLEITDAREMFSDVLNRSYRRYLETDERSEVEAIEPMKKLAGMMSQSVDKILTIDNALANKSTKTIVEEMLEVVQPTLERIEKEQRDALDAASGIFREGGKDFNGDDNADEPILGLND